MKGTLFIVLAVLTLSATTAIPARMRRAINPDDDEIATPSSVEPTERVCAPMTPCGWEIYNGNTKTVYSKILNTYCKCGEGSTCEEKGDDTSASVYIYKCRPTPAS